MLSSDKVVLLSEAEALQEKCKRYEALIGILVEALGMQPVDDPIVCDLTDAVENLALEKAGSPLLSSYYEKRVRLIMG